MRLASEASFGSLHGCRTAHCVSWRRGPEAAHPGGKRHESFRLLPRVPRKSEGPTVLHSRFSEHGEKGRSLVTRLSIRPVASSIHGRQRASFTSTRESSSTSVSTGHALGLDELLESVRGVLGVECLPENCQIILKGPHPKLNPVASSLSLIGTRGIRNVIHAADLSDGTGEQELMGLKGSWELVFGAYGHFAEAYVGNEFACLSAYDGLSKSWEVDAAGRVEVLDLDDHEVWSNGLHHSQHSVVASLAFHITQFSACIVQVLCN